MMDAGATEVPARRGRWLRAIAYGLLAEVATIFTIIVIVMIYRQAIAPGLSEAEYASFGERAGGIIGVLAGTAFTYLFARFLMKRLAWHYVGHGLVVAAAAIVLSVAGSIGGHQSVPAAYILASFLKLLAGALAGWLYSRSPQHHQPGA